jgi:hypothetical protein
MFFIFMYLHLFFKFHGLCKCFTSGFHFLFRKAFDICQVPVSKIFNHVATIWNLWLQFMTLVASVPGKQILAVTLWIHLSFQLSGQLFCLLAQALMGPKIVTDFFFSKFAQILLIVRCE